MTKKTRRNFLPKEKVAILKQHLLEGKSVSDISASFVMEEIKETTAVPL